MLASSAFRKGPGERSDLGQAPASNAEVEHAGEGFRYDLRDKDLMGMASTLDGSTSAENLDKCRYGLRRDNWHRPMAVSEPNRQSAESP
jgi:hypothetical protein